MDKVKFTPSYCPLDMEASVAEFDEGVQIGETCHIPELNNIFAWMRGFVNMWTGWSNDGKGTMLDFLMTLKAKNAGWKWCIYKLEDMDSVRIGGNPKLKNGQPIKVGNRVVKTGGKIHIKANHIYKNLAWCLTGKTWIKEFADRNMCKQMTFQEELEALEFITEHFFVINPQDRTYKNVFDDFLFMYEKFGIDGFLIDPWSSLVLPSVKGETGDVKFVNAFIENKNTALLTDSCFNIITHAKAIEDVKYKSGPDKGKYKVVDPSMVLGGAAWDMKMDGCYSIYRPERHLDPRDPKVHLYNFKQRKSEVVGASRGVYENIQFDAVRKQYYFNGVNPLSGENKFKNSPSDVVPF